MIIFNLNGENQFENFILQGKYDKAKELIVELKQRYRDSQQKLFMVNLLEISLLIEAEQWDICLEKIIALEKNSNKIDSTFLKSLYHLYKIFLSLEMGHYEKILNDLSIILEGIESLNDKKQSNYLYGYYYLLKGNFYRIHGERKDALNFCQKSLDFFSEINFTRFIVIAQNELGHCYQTLGENEKAKGYLDEALKICEKISYKKGLAITYNRISNLKLHSGFLAEQKELLEKSLEIMLELQIQPFIGKIYNNLGTNFELKGDLVKALEYYNSALSIFKQNNYEHLSSLIEYNIGSIYFKRGELDAALENLNEALRIFQQSNNHVNIVACFNYIGRIFHQKGNLEQALIHFQLGLQLRDQINLPLHTSRTLYYAIKVLLDLNNLDLATQYFKDLFELNKKAENKIIDQRVKIANAMILKTKIRSKSIVQAEEILSNVINEEIIDHELTIDALITLCEIYIIELKQTGNTEVIVEINSIISKLIEIGKNQQSKLILAEGYWLQSQISLLELDFKKAMRTLSQAELLANEWGLNRLAIRISSEHDRLLDQLEIFEDSMRKKKSMKERLEAINLEDFLTKILRNKQYNPPDVSNEKPKLIIVVHKSGLPIYSKFFNDESNKKDDALIAGFLTAINNFALEAIDLYGSIERIKYSDHTIMIQNLESLFICYVYQGPSFGALRKIIQLIENLKINEKIWHELTSMSNLSLPLSQETHELLDNLTLTIFEEKV